jgi:hypothetical protein
MVLPKFLEEVLIPRIRNKFFDDFDQNLEEFLIPGIKNKFFDSFAQILGRSP